MQFRIRHVQNKRKSVIFRESMKGYGMFMCDLNYFTFFGTDLHLFPISFSNCVNCQQVSKRLSIKKASYRGKAVKLVSGSAESSKNCIYKLLSVF